MESLQKALTFFIVVLATNSRVKAGDCTTCMAYNTGECVVNQAYCGNQLIYQQPTIEYSSVAGCKQVTLTCNGYGAVYMSAVTITDPTGADGGALISQSDSSDMETLLTASSTLICDSTGTWTFGGAVVGNLFDCQVWIPVNNTNQGGCGAKK